MIRIYKTQKDKNGFSMLEVILAIALFVIFSSGLVTLVLQSYSASRLGGEETIATQFASEGIESIKSIKNQGYSNLVNSTGVGVIRSGSGIWQFSGTNNTYDKYQRVLKVEDVYRDVSKNIVASGGTLDLDTKKITSTVSWAFTSGRSNTVELISYLTNFRKPILSASNGVIIYSDSAVNPTFPRTKDYVNSSNTFGSENQITSGALGRNFVVRTSPTKNEAVAGYTDNAGNLRVLCYDGSNWSSEWTASVGGTGTTKRFDLAYETNTGDVLVLYSTNGTSNELSYRTKPGAQNCGNLNWSSATTFDSPGTNGVVQWVKMAWDKRASSNLITAIWADANSDLQGANWSGTSWTQRASAFETSLETASTAQDVDDFDVEYESLSGDIMVVWANSAGRNGTNGVRYVTCPGGNVSCTWSSTSTPSTFTDDATNLDISANPNSDQIVFASIGNAGSDLQIGYWGGASWTNTQNADTSCNAPSAGTKLVSTGWLVSGTYTRSVIVYVDQGSSLIDWFTGNNGTFTKGTPANISPNFNSLKYLDLQMDPINKDRLMYTAVDSSNDLFAKRLVLSSSGTFAWIDANAGSTLGVSLAQSISQPFSFSYWRY